jgi:ribosomal protein S18 acetylase RimI-like enzyme
MTVSASFLLRGQTIASARDQDSADLARFCVTNPGYDILLTGEVPEPEAWVRDFLTDLPPAQFNPGATFKFVVRDGEGVAVGEIVAVVDVTLDMIDRGVGHIGLFQVAEARHGSGLAHRLYAALEGWLVQQGMDVVRLGVLTSNPRGARFWARHGYRPTRQRSATLENGRVVVTDVLVKPIGASSAAQPFSLDAYRARVPRDDPASP